MIRSVHCIYVAAACLGLKMWYDVVYILHYKMRSKLYLTVLRDSSRILTQCYTSGILGDGARRPRDQQPGDRL